MSTTKNTTKNTYKIGRTANGKWIINTRVYFIDYRLPYERTTGLPAVQHNSFSFSTKRDAVAYAEMLLAEGATSEQQSSGELLVSVDTISPLYA